MLAGKLFGIPVKGTHAHAFVNSFTDLNDIQARVRSSSFGSSNRILPFVYTFSGIFVELLKVIQSAGMFK